MLDIVDMLNEYSQDIQEEMTKAAEENAKDGANELKVAPLPKKRTGKYAKGWKVKTIKGNGYVKSIVYNTNPGLTQILEKPHVIRNQFGEWGTSKPIVHIKPVEEKYVRQYQREVERIIKNGG